MVRVGEKNPTPAASGATEPTDVQVAKSTGSVRGDTTVEPAAVWEGTGPRHSQEPVSEPWVDRTAPVGGAEATRRNAELLTNLAYVDDPAQATPEHIMLLKADLGIGDGTASVTGEVLNAVRGALKGVAEALHKFGYQKVDAGLYSDALKAVVGQFQEENNLVKNGRLTNETTERLEEQALDLVEEEFVAWPARRPVSEPPRLDDRPKMGMS